MSDTSTAGLSTLSRVLMPALMFQAVAIGGAYAAGREIIAFGGAYGALGWAAGAAMAAMRALLAFLVYETARRHRLFEYRAMPRHLIGRFAWLFYAIYIPFAIAILAVLSSATGNILDDTLGLPYWLGVGIIVAISAWVVFQGTEVMERFNGLGTIALMVAALRGSTPTASQAYLDRSGKQSGLTRHTIGVRMDRGMSHRGDWVLGVKSGGTLHRIAVRARR